MTTTIKVLSRSEKIDTIATFMTCVLEESSIVPESIEEIRRGVAVTLNDEDAESVVDAILDCYETMGIEIPGNVEIDVFELAVIISDAELQAYYTQMRLNFNCVQTDTLGGVVFDTAHGVENIDKKVDRIDSLCELNGVYKMRQIVTTMASEMEMKGIVVADAINKIVGSTVH